MKFDPYRNYTSTTNFAGQDETALTEWSIGYFIANIGQHLPKDKHARILEIGCGYGRNIRALQKLGYCDVRGIDISGEQVEYATRILGLSNVIVEDAVDSLADTKETYDVILLLDVLEHLELAYSVKLIGLIKSTLKPGGIFIIQVPNGLAPLMPNRYGDITHLRAYTTHSMDQHLRLGGFTEIRHYELPPYVHGMLSLVRRILWAAVIKPLIAVLMLVANGSVLGGIYTANMLTIAHRE